MFLTLYHDQGIRLSGDIIPAKPGVDNNPHTSYELKATASAFELDGWEISATKNRRQWKSHFSYKGNSAQECCKFSWLQSLKYKQLSLRLLTSLDDLRLSPVRPRWCDLTDAGPGVNISNFEVRFKNAKLARMWNSDDRIRVYWAHENSSQGEAESKNSVLAFGDAVIDRGSIILENILIIHWFI